MDEIVYLRSALWCCPVMAWHIYLNIWQGLVL